MMVLCLLVSVICGEAKLFKFKENYSNDPRFSDRYAWANSADKDQTAPDQGLHCLPFLMHLLDALL